MRSFVLASVVILLLGTARDSAAQDSNPAIDALRPFANGSSQRELIRAIGTLCFAGNRLSDRLQQDCNALVGGAFGSDSNVRGALAQIVADNVNQTTDRTQFVGTDLLLMQVGVVSSRGPGGGGFLPAANGGVTAASEDFDAWSLHAAVDLRHRDRERSVNEDGFDSDHVGLLLGLDRRFTPQLNAGVAVGFGQGDVEFGGGSGDQDIDEHKLLLYANWSGDSGLYLDVLASWQRRDIEQSRRVAYALAGGTGVDQRFSANFDADATALAATLGYHWQHGNMGLDGFINIESTSIEVDGYSETASSADGNGAGWAIAVPDSDSDITTAELGWRASWSISGKRSVWLPQLEVAYVKVIDQDESATAVQFLGDRSGSVGLSNLIFALSNDEEDDDYFRLGAGLVAQWAEGRSGFINVSTHLGESRYDATSLTLGARFEF
ncbi:autotransporter outer membrane beta-barrel domain-containing protein [Pseudomarimonas arenosa]|uniref:Autotransporter outer membrane beta-barrel domain-containing protein n=1 Tax=Pseudomarimonas arenosa TaxID=2774145 RepID=A0AAW3ZJN6_9GAMM|nr:autotransporter outer membrane beta-barrel domain-containing protein [Pseudomarimonas arenosa]MBD8525665.1 autotransporter outer membrane beta-barrel domain-containing protein [Pseudomarimonas arenosa]